MLSVGLKRKLIMGVAFVALAAIMPAGAPVWARALKSFFLVRSVTKEPKRSTEYTPVRFTETSYVPLAYYRTLWEPWKDPAPIAPVATPPPVVAQPVQVQRPLGGAASVSLEHRVAPAPRVATTRRTVRYTYSPTSRVYRSPCIRYSRPYAWWDGGPLRRILSAPFRFFGRRCW